MKASISKKHQFVEAVKLMAPGNEFIARVARLVREEDLPPITGVAAFELAATLETLCKSWRFRRPLQPCHTPRALTHPSFVRRDHLKPKL